MVDSLFGSYAADPGRVIGRVASKQLESVCVGQSRSVLRCRGASVPPRPRCFASVLRQALGGCLLGTEKPDAALDMPAAYRMAPHDQDAALPSVVWWRGFR